MGFQAQTCSHLYMLNPDIDEFKIAVATTSGREKNMSCELEAGNAIEEVPSSFSSFFNNLKSALIIENRYLRHPYYDYRLYPLETGGSVEGLAVCRVVEAMGARALRIVDLQINPGYISRIGRCVEELISRNDCEYADILQVGLPVEEFLKAGFQLLDHDGSTVIPNYFEPFLSKNVKVEVCYKCDSGDNLIAFKGDGDQDRPNVL